MIKNLIASDIDGTLTQEAGSLPDPVIRYLHQLYQQGWHFIFVTGRSFSFTYPTLAALDFPFYLGVQNGATLLTMPQKKVIREIFLKREHLERLLPLVTVDEVALLVEGGFASGDVTWYCPSHLSAVDLDYIAYRKQITNAPFQAISSWDELSVQQFPLFKIFGPHQTLQDICDAVPAPITPTLIHDPFRRGYAIALLTHQMATKGHAVEALLQKNSEYILHIASGDDQNDLSFLKLAPIRIVMQTAPESVKKVATIIAPPAINHGIIKALDEALTQIKP